MLEINNLVAGYGERRVLSGISLTLENGELTSVIGPNGSGKSTLLKAIIGVVQSSSGEIISEDRNLLSLSYRERAKKLSYLPQGKPLPDMSVRQMVLHGRFPHIEYPRKYTARDREIALGAMQKMGVDSFADSPLSSLSGGMRQNAYLALCLAQDTEFLLLDEPTTYLDIKNQLSLMRRLRSLAEEGRGILTVMHDITLALNFSDKIAVLSGGNIVFYGTPQEVLKSGIIKTVFDVEINNDYSLKIKK